MINQKDKDDLYKEWRKLIDVLAVMDCHDVACVSIRTKAMRLGDAYMRKAGTNIVMHAS
jgi:hypothetical protein